MLALQTQQPQAQQAVPTLLQSAQFIQMLQAQQARTQQASAMPALQVTHPLAQQAVQTQPQPAPLLQMVQTQQARTQPERRALQRPQKPTTSQSMAGKENKRPDDDDDDDDDDEDKRHKFTKDQVLDLVAEIKTAKEEKEAITQHAPFWKRLSNACGRTADVLYYKWQGDIILT
ncbi:hypothetical protein QJQ45_010303 [Haematococcus lacustris]|nr:hypothetical protein QJQ45_010303 [Haematococcus lacustris]